MRSLLVSAVLALLSIPACGGGGGMGDDGDDGDDTSAPDASAPPAGFVEVIGRDWTIAPGETYKCIRIRVERDMWIGGFHAEAPDGTHHTVFTISNSSSPLGEYDCSAGSLDFQMLYASGPATDDLLFPEGVAMHLTQGQYLNLNLHLFNTQPAGDLSGHSSIWVKEIAEADVVHEAEMVFAGQAEFTIPGDTGAEPYSVSGGCTFNNSASILAYWPHMHQYAVHQKVTLTRGGTDSLVHDEPYDFYEQKNYPVPGTVHEVAAGDSISVECLYENHTGDAIGFGDSSTQEMCFTGLYRYPKQALYLFECTEGLGSGGL